MENYTDDNELFTRILRKLYMHLGKEELLFMDTFKERISIKSQEDTSTTTENCKWLVT